MSFITQTPLSKNYKAAKKIATPKHRLLQYIKTKTVTFWNYFENLCYIWFFNAYSSFITDAEYRVITKMSIKISSITAKNPAAF